MAHEYRITIELEGSDFNVLLDGEPLSTHPTVDGARFAALQTAREIDPDIERLAFQNDAEGNFFTTINGAE